MVLKMFLTSAIISLKRGKISNIMLNHHQRKSNHCLHIPYYVYINIQVTRAILYLYKQPTTERHLPLYILLFVSVFLIRFGISVRSRNYSHRAGKRCLWGSTFGPVYNAATKCSYIKYIGKTQPIMQPLQKQQGKVIMWSFCLMLSRREIAFKYDDGINLFGTFRIIIIIS